MEKKVAIVTGAGKGIGAACARALNSSGFRIAVHYNSSKESAEKLMNELGNDAFLVQGDLSTIEGCDAVYEQLRTMKISLEILVNNAGMVKDNPIFNSSVEDFEKTINLNLRGTWYLTKRLVRLMIRNKTGRIINISSVVGSQGNPTQSIYGMTKAAIDNFTQVAAKEFADQNILVNSIAPGFIDTEMTDRIPGEIKEKILEHIPLKRVGKPEEIAEVVQFLATAGTYITGSTIHVNGGMYGN